MASTRKASIAAELRADRAKFKQDLDAAKRDVKAFGDEARKAGGSFNPGGGFSGFKQKFSQVKQSAGQAKSIVGQVLAIAEEVKDKTAIPNAWYGDMVDGLAAVMGSAEAAKKHIGQLRLISDEMALSDDQFENIVEYSIRLQAWGQSADEAAEFIRELANTAEGMGTGVEKFEQFISALDKMDQEGKASLGTIAEMTKAMPKLRKVLEEGFGTSVPKDLEAMKLTSKEMIDGVLRGMKALETAQPSAVDKTVAEWDRGKLNLGGDAEDNNGELAERRMMSEEDLAAARIKLMEAVEFRRKEAADERAAEGRAELERQKAILDSQKLLTKAELQGDKEKVALWEDRITVMEKAADLAKELGISEKEAVAALIQQNEIRRETTALADEVRTPEQQAGMARTKDQMEIDRLRSRGKNKEADKRQKALDIAADTDRFKAEGFSPDEAAAMAEQGQQTKEDQEYFDKTGRNKMRGAKSKNRKSGIDGEFATGRFDFASFFDTGMGVDFSQKPPAGQKLSAANKALEENRAETNAAKNNPGITAEKFAELLISQRELINAVKELQTAGERTAPKPPTQ